MDNQQGVDKRPFILAACCAVGAGALVVYDRLSGGKLISAVSAVWNTLLPILQKIGTAMKFVGQTTFSFFATVINAVKNGGSFLINAIASAVSDVGLFFKTAANIVGSLLVGTKNVLVSIGGFIGKAAYAIARFAQAAWTAILPYIKAGWAGFKDLAARGWALLKFGVQQTWKALSPLLARAWSATKTFFVWLGLQIKERVIPVIKDLAARAWVIIKELAKQFVALMRTPAGLSGAAILAGASLYTYGINQASTLKRVACVVAGAGLVVGGAFIFGMKFQAGLAFVPVI